jgi:hypothetical protein
VGEVSVADNADDETTGLAALAKPKSMSLGPVLVSMMLLGFRSRCTTPLRWALSSPSQILIPHFRTCSGGSGPLRRRSARVSPSRYSMTR